MLLYDILTEMVSDVIEPIAPGYATEKDDNSAMKLSDVRKTKLTLGQINKLRQINDVRRVEHAQKLETLGIQYAAPSSESGM